MTALLPTSTKKFSTPKPERREAHPDDPPCFDLADPRCYGLARAIYRSRCARRLMDAGVEREDGWQTVCMGLLRKSKSEGSRWDPTRGSLSTWLTVAIYSLTAHILQAASRRLRTHTGRDSDASTWDVAYDPWTTEEAPPPPPGSVLDIFGVKEPGEASVESVRGAGAR